MSNGSIRFSLNQSMAISLVRIISTLMIIMCHVFQGYNHILAWWFNVGVQVFLFMSGFLLAQSTYETKFEYIQKRFKRIMIPYWLLLIMAIPVYYITGTKIRIPFNEIPLYITGTIGIRRIFVVGLDHLWFLAVLVICYIVSMLLHDVKDKLKELNTVPFYLILITSLSFLPSLEHINLLPLGYAPWLATFILGFLISYRYEGKIPRLFALVLGILTIYTSGVRVYNEHFARINLLSPYFVPWSKFLLGSFIFVSLYLLFVKIDWRLMPRINKWVKVIDSYTYETYLTHQNFILGPLSLLYFTSSKTVNLLVISVLIVISTIVLKKITTMVYMKLDSLQKDSLKDVSKTSIAS